MGGHPRSSLEEILAFRVARDSGFKGEQTSGLHL